MKIVHLSLRADGGGGPEHILQLSRLLVECFNVGVICPDDRPYSARYKDEGFLISASIVPHRKVSFQSLLRFLWVVFQLREPLLHAHGFGASVYLILARLFVRSPSVVTYHGSFFAAGGIKGYVTGSLIRMFEALGVLCICVSKEELKELNQRYGSHYSRIIILNGVAAGRSKIIGELGHQSTLEVVTVSRFDTQKNPDELFSVIVKSCANNPILRWTVLGDGEGRELFLQKLETVALSNRVRVLGYVNDPRSFYRNSDLFFSCSRWEGLPLAVLEAMSEGLPVVLSRVTGHKEIFELGAPGLVYDLGDVPAAVVAILSFQSDLSLRRESSRESLRIFNENFNFGVMLNRYKLAYRLMEYAHFDTIEL